MMSPFLLIIIIIIIIIKIITAVNCGTLTTPTNGRVSYTAGTTFGRTATYSCYTGFTHVGASTRTCQATGVWSGSAPTCQGMLLLPSMCTTKANIYFCPSVCVK